MDEGEEYGGGFCFLDWALLDPSFDVRASAGIWALGVATFEHSSSA